MVGKALRKHHCNIVRFTTYPLPPENIAALYITLVNLAYCHHITPSIGVALIPRTFIHSSWH